MLICLTCGNATRGERSKSPSWIKYGSITSSTVASSSDMAAAMVFESDRPPLNFSINISKNFLSDEFRPISSNREHVQRFLNRLLVQTFFLLTWAKSRQRFKK